MNIYQKCESDSISDALNLIQESHDSHTIFHLGKKAPVDPKVFESANNRDTGEDSYRSAKIARGLHDLDCDWSMTTEIDKNIIQVMIFRKNGIDLSPQFEGILP